MRQFFCFFARMMMMMIYFVAQQSVNKGDCDETVWWKETLTRKMEGREREQTKQVPHLRYNEVKKNKLK